MKIVLNFYHGNRKCLSERCSAVATKASTYMKFHFEKRTIKNRLGFKIVGLSVAVSTIGETHTISSEIDI